MTIVKISASIYSDKKRPLKEVILDLENHNVDMLHVDCNDDDSVFQDIIEIKKWTSLPIDLHIISSNPERFFPLLIQTPVEYITFQYESIKNPLVIPSKIITKKGIAVSGDTPISIFSDYLHFDFILIMATTPGQSGGVFDTLNFKKIRDFKKQYPDKSIHVDGGVNAEVSFILRNMGVSTSVSGSYLFSSASIGHALMNLTNRNIESHYLVKDFMIPFDECPFVNEKSHRFMDILQSIENGQLGFTLVVNEKNKFIGIISNADVRRGLLKNNETKKDFDSIDFINRNALSVNQKNSVKDLLSLIKKSKFPILYLPVIDDNQKAVGIVTFMNLIKGEL
ncbi:MAG: CBS domain-containing protein [Flavobacteriia bacterium]|nr:CBS domain-containing protein [Flavobacteriia bacterium]